MNPEPYIIIPVPEELTAKEVYLYLVNTPQGRRKLLEMVDEKRFSTWESVFVIHRSIPYPFLFTPFMTDKIFVTQINARLNVLLG